jgi:hypothetical protein
MAAPHIGHSIIRVLNFFVVVIVVLLLLHLLGRPIATALPGAAQSLGDMLRGLWEGIKNIVPDTYYQH